MLLFSYNTVDLLYHLINCRRRSPNPVHFLFFSPFPKTSHMYRSRTPPPSSRYGSSRARSTRAARGVSKTRRGRNDGNSSADRLRRSAESGPVQKWVKVMRSPAPHISFVVPKWVPVIELTDEERRDYDKEMEEKMKRQLQQQQQQQQQQQTKPEQSGSVEIKAKKSEEVSGGGENSSTSNVNDMAMSSPKEQIIINEESKASLTLTEEPKVVNQFNSVGSEEPATKKIRLDDAEVMGGGKTFNNTLTPPPNLVESSTQESTITPKDESKIEVSKPSNTSNEIASEGNTSVSNS